MEEKKEQFKSDIRLIDIFQRAFKEKGKSYQLGPIIAVRKIVVRKERKNNLYQKYKAFAVDMEAKSIAEISNSNNIPFLAIKVISDLADERSGFSENLITETGKVNIIEAIVTFMFNPIATICNINKMRTNIKFAFAQLKPAISIETITDCYKL